MRTRLIALVLLVTGAVTAGGAAGTAEAAFPGANGKLAFVKAGNVWVADADGSEPVQLTTDPAFDRSPRWSPDGTKIAFSSNRDGDFEIFVMNADGSDQTQLTFNAGAQDRIPSWTADGTQIVYDKNFLEIYAINSDGSGGERKLADGFIPGTSAYGDKVVFGHDGLVTMQLAGSARHRITEDPTDFSANWSPQRNDLVFTRSTETDRDIYLVHANGTGLTRLTNTPDRFEFAPVWSPDDTKMAFVGCSSVFGMIDCEIYEIGRDGGETQVTTFGVFGGEGAVDWQPLSNAER
jgi:Tol biopolymer transport system component